MNAIWQRQSPLVKTLLVCTAIELGLFIALYFITRSSLAAIVCSVGIFGPASLVLGPPLLRRFKLAPCQGI